MKQGRQRVWWLAPFAVVLIAVIAFGAVCYRHEHAIDSIEQLGGRIVSTHGGPAWLVRLLGGRSLPFWEQQTVVNLSGTTVTDDDLTYLARLTGVERLNLSDTSISNPGLRHLDGMNGLKALDLSRTQITGDGLKSLHGLNSIEYLYLSGTEVTDRDLAPLFSMSHLKDLALDGTDVSQDGVKQIKSALPSVNVMR